MFTEPCSTCCPIFPLQAWNYARFVTAAFYSRRPRTLLEVECFVDRHAEFCLAHVSDTSCWSFLLFLFFKTRREFEEFPARTTLFDLTKGAMRFAHETARGHESVWVFLKTVLTNDKILEYEQRRDLIELLTGWVDDQGGNGGEDELKERGLERKALEWIRGRRGSHSGV